MYDKDGYYVLLPRKNVGRRRARRQVGEHQLIHNELNLINPSTATSGKIKIRCSGASGFDIEYASKSWQRKVWDSISPIIDLNSAPIMSESKCNQRQHLIALAVYMVVRGESANRSPVRYDSLQGTKSIGQYVYADTEGEVLSIFSNMAEMLTTKVNYYIALGKRDRCDVGYIFKAMAIYDDLSYDVLSGNPNLLFKLFDIKCNELGGIHV